MVLFNNEGTLYVFSSQLIHLANVELLQRTRNNEHYNYAFTGMCDT